MSEKKSVIKETRSYDLFKSHEPENRPLDLKKHKKLRESMQQYGFLRCFPVVVYRDPDGDGRLVVKDGQHRLAFAQELGLPVYYVEEVVNFDIAVVNSTGKNWTLRDYAEKHLANGLTAYGEGLEFSKNHSLPIGTAFALLSGTTSFNNTHDAFIKGQFKVKDREWADAVAYLYTGITLLAPETKTARLIEACMAVCRVEGFESRRLIDGAKRCREKLLSYSTRDAYLDMMEAVYNYGRKQLVGLKSAALMAMRERSAVPANHRKKGSPDLPAA